MKDSLAGRIIVHVTCTSSRGGIASMLLPLLEELNRRCRVEVIAFDRTPIIELAQAKGITVRVFPMKGKLGLTGLIRAYHYLRTKRVDIIHSHDYKSNFIAFILGKILHVPNFTTVHGLTIFVGRIDNLFNTLKLKIYALNDLFLLRFFDQLIAISENTREFLVKMGVKPSKIVTIYNGINADHFRFINREEVGKLKNELKIREKDCVLGVFARLVALKGHQYIIKAMPAIIKQFPTTKLLIVGEGPLEGELKRLAKSLGIGNNVIFAGYREDVTSLYHLIDLFVYPALYEGFGLTVVEAMACGKPVVATEVFAIPEIVLSGETGLLVPAKDVDSLVRAVCHLLRDPAIAIKFGQNGKKRVLEKFLISRNIEKTVSLYSNSLNA